MVVQNRALKPAERLYKVADVDRLYLLVQPSGALLWRFRYRCCGIERKLSLGLVERARVHCASRFAFFPGASDRSSGRPATTAPEVAARHWPRGSVPR
ncbi:Arm DNA-binding domain-containing protein [Sphingomonas sp. PP-F2F-G114-C0414]|uniref:Arm DNA-binding domain-containing protein n=1 Tax=Sphingomonas sp. PP-F2F-G114-C0414 TaxID=2135662 RepID=UPI0038574223